MVVSVRWLSPLMLIVVLRCHVRWPFRRLPRHVVIITLIVRCSLEAMIRLTISSVGIWRLTPVIIKVVKSLLIVVRVILLRQVMTKKIVFHLIVCKFTLIRITCAVAQPIGFGRARWLLNYHSISDLFENLQSFDDVFVYQIKLVQKRILRKNESLFQTIDVLI